MTSKALIYHQVSDSLSHFDNNGKEKIYKMLVDSINHRYDLRRSPKDAMVIL